MFVDVVRYPVSRLSVARLASKVAKYSGKGSTDSEFLCNLAEPSVSCPDSDGLIEEHRGNQVNVCDVDSTSVQFPPLNELKQLSDFCDWHLMQ